MAEAPVAEVIAPAYKRPFIMFLSIVGGVSFVLMSFSAAERMVDGRIDIRLAAQKAQVEDHEKRLTKIEEKLGNMTEVLSEIRSDVKVLRVQMEKK